MRPDRAREHLQELRVRADDAIDGRAQIDYKAWRAQVRAVVARSLGEDHDLVAQISKASFSLGMFTDRTPQSAFEQARLQGVRTVVSYIDAAVYELNLLDDDDAPLEGSNFDPALWAHVHELVERGDWAKVASQTAIFVEDRFRVWSGVGRDKVGKGLFAAALGDAGPLRLGYVAGEHEGWRALGVGLAQAVSNVDRHHIQDRADAQRYAIGVLGLGSLLLTQLRHQHPECADDPDAA